MTKLKIELANNSDARRWSALLPSVPARHNGGKTMIAIVDDSDVERVRARLDEADAVKSYTYETA